MTDPESLTIRPYARLLTMLGEQLIKNERIALIELIKNSYDADSPWVKITFEDFKDNYTVTHSSKIIIEDAGEGMTSEVIRKHWVNPATPIKKKRKGKKPKTKKGRFIQGEKGIGRFSLLKLGRKVTMYTRALAETDEHVVEYDFSKYDDEFLSVHGEEEELFIDNLTITILTRAAKIIKEEKIRFGSRLIKRPGHGTRIEISNLKGNWSEKKVQEVYNDIARLESIFHRKMNKQTKKTLNTSFDVRIFKDNKQIDLQERYLEKLYFLLEDRSVLKIENGSFDDSKNEFNFMLDGKPQVLKLSNPKISGLQVFRTYFGKKGELLDERKVSCGPFKFGFYVFDLTKNIPAKFQLDNSDIKIIKNHRIYIYRDGFRVLPYGDSDDDWLRIDAYRGTKSAAHYLSNDQVVGYLEISHKENPKLKDKTNREGLIEEGNATQDFIALVQIFLAYVRQAPYKIHRQGLKDKNVLDIFQTKKVEKQFENLKEILVDNKKAGKLVANIEKEYKAERGYLVQRAETTEDLAGVGLSVEAASHDIMAIMGKTKSTLNSLIEDCLHDDIDQGELQKELQSLRGMLSFIEDQLSDIQLLFKSSKKRRKNIGVKSILEKVERIYRRILKNENIELTVKPTGSPLIAKTTDAVLLQLFINLFDNAVYWHQSISKKKKKIDIHLDGENGQMIFSDNGPGVNKEYAPYIFEPFFSGKGEEGRGLGLYIARQLLERNDYSIDLAELKSDKILSGANFVVSFIAEG